MGNQVAQTRACTGFESAISTIITAREIPISWLNWLISLFSRICLASIIPFTADKFVGSAPDQVARKGAHAHVGDINDVNIFNAAQMRIRLTEISSILVSEIYTSPFCEKDGGIIGAECKNSHSPSFRVSRSSPSKLCALELPVAFLKAR